MTFQALFHHTDEVFVISRSCGLFDIFHCDLYAKIREQLAHCSVDRGDQPPYEFIPVLVEEICNLVPVYCGSEYPGWWCRTATLSKHNYGIYEYGGIQTVYHIVLAFNIQEAERLLFTDPEVCSMQLREADVQRLGRKR